MKMNIIYKTVGALLAAILGFYIFAGNPFDTSKREVSYYFTTSPEDTNTYQVEFFYSDIYDININSIFVAKYSFLDSRKDQFIHFKVISSNGSTDDRLDIIRPSFGNGKSRWFVLSPDRIKTKINGPIGVLPPPPPAPNSIAIN